MDSEDNHHTNQTLIILLSYHPWARQSIVLGVFVVGRVGLVVVGVYTASTLQFSALSINAHLTEGLRLMRSLDSVVLAFLTAIPNPSTPHDVFKL